MGLLGKIVAEEPRGRGRPRDGDCRERILRAGLELLEESAFADITTDAIAERAGASKATIYRWWPNKASVLIEALRDAVAQDMPFPQYGRSSPGYPAPVEELIKLLTGRRGRIFKAFIAAAQSDPEVAQTFEAVWRHPRRATAKIALERYRGQALREDVDTDFVMDALYGPVYYRLLVGRGPLSESYADSISDMVLEGIVNRNHEFTPDAK